MDSNLMLVIDLPRGVLVAGSGSQRGRKIESELRIAVQGWKRQGHDETA